MAPAADPSETSSSAKLLTQDTVAEYVSSHASEIQVFPGDAVLTAEAIQGGNVNFAFCVRSAQDAEKAVFVKQAPEYVAVFGPDGLPLTSSRIEKEVAILQEWNSILGEEAQTYLPKLYYFDDAEKVFVMEFLENYILLDHHLVTNPAPATDVSIAARLGQFIAKTHLATHASQVSPDRAAQLAKDYENRAMRDIQLEYVFTKCYREISDTTTKGFSVTEEFLAEVNALKARYNGETMPQNMVLCHGDLHPGSVMVSLGDEDQGGAQVRVIDAEFTIYGPPGLDLGSLLSGYILAAVHQSYCNTKKDEEKAAAVKAVCDGVKTIWQTYQDIMLKGGLSSEIMRQIEVETVGFAVAEVCRTALGFAGIRLWLQFEDPVVKESAVQAALSIVQKCMMARHDKGIQTLLDCLNDVMK